MLDFIFICNIYQNYYLMKVQIGTVIENANGEMIYHISLIF